MRIGITYDLRSEYLAEGLGEEAIAEFDREETIDAIEAALVELGHEALRIGRARALIDQLADGQRWDLVFNICEGLHGFGREAQVPAILDVYQIPYTFADPLVMSLCLHKHLTKLIVERDGVPTPRGWLVQRNADLDAITAPFPLFAKPVAQGTSKGVTPQSRIDSQADLAVVCQALWNQFQEPVLVETYLPGREFTVGILGTGEPAHVLGTLEIVMRRGADADVYSYRNKEHCEALVDYRLVSGRSDAEVREAERLALIAWRGLQGRDAGRVDLRSDAHGQPHFIEANPLAGMHPTHSDLPMLATALDLPYTVLIDRILQSACARCVAV